MATFLVKWERFGRLHDGVLQSWNDCYEEFSGTPLLVERKAREFVETAKSHPKIFGSTRRFRIFKLIEGVD